MRDCLSKNGVECGTVYQRMELSAGLFIKEWSGVGNCLSKSGVECGTVY